jgi:outer membrane lipoprotein-sorting protein
VRLTLLQQDPDKLFFAASGVLMLFLAGGCAAASHPAAVKPSGAPEPPVQVASKQDLISRYNRQVESVTSLNASVTMTLTAGSSYTGVIKQYHEIDGFLLAQKPASIRVIGQAPVVATNIFDMVSDGETFHIFIPSQNKFVTGSANLPRQSTKPIENLRPQHLTSAIFWAPIPDHVPVLIEEANEAGSRYYVLTVVRPLGERVPSAADGSADWEIARRIWFDRSHLNITRVETYESAGQLASDVSLRDWEVFQTVNYPRQIVLSRPDSDYKLQIGIKKVTFNEMISADRFILEQPPGTELVNAGAAVEPSAPEQRQEKQN